MGHCCVTDAVGNEGDPTLAIRHAATAALQDTKGHSVTMGVQSRGLRWGRAAALLGTGRALLQQCPPPRPSAETVTCGAKKTPCSPPPISPHCWQQPCSSQPPPSAIWGLQWSVLPWTTPTAAALS